MYAYIPSFLGFLSHLGHHNTLGRVPCATQKFLFSYISYTVVCICQRQSQSIPCPAFPLGIHTVVCTLHLGLKGQRWAERKSETREAEEEKQENQGSRRRGAFRGKGGVSLIYLRCCQLKRWKTALSGGERSVSMSEISPEERKPVNG